MDLVFRLFVPLENMDTHSNLVFADDAAVQRIFTATEVATGGKVHAVLDTVSVTHDCT